MAVTDSITPVLQKVEKQLIFQEIGGFDFYKLKFWLSRFRLNLLLYVLEYFQCEEENESQILLALYIGLEFSLLLKWWNAARNNN